MSLSSSFATSGVRLGKKHTPGSLPVPPLTALHTFSAPLLSPIVQMQRGMTSWTPPVPWVLQRDDLCWNRTSSRYQGMSVSGPGGPYPPVFLSGRWPPSPISLLLCPGRGQTWRIPRVTFRLVQRRPRCWGWPAAQTPTPFGGTSAVQRKIPTGAYVPPLIISLSSLPTPAPSHQTTWYMRPSHRWSDQGSGFLWPPSFPCPGSIPRLWPRSAGLQPRCSWLVPGSIPLVAPGPGYPWSLQVCYQNYTCWVEA